MRLRRTQLPLMPRLTTLALFILLQNFVKFVKLLYVNEQEIYNNAFPKNLLKYGPLPNCCKVAEVMRIHNFDHESNCRVPASYIW